MTLNDWYARYASKLEVLCLQVRLTPVAVRELTQYQENIEKKSDGTGILRLQISSENIPYFGRLFMTLGRHAVVESPTQVVDYIRSVLADLLRSYEFA